MNYKNKDCRKCIWHLNSAPADAQTASCGHTNYKIRKEFRDHGSAENCKGYLEDDPNLQVQIQRDTRESLMKGIHQMAVDNGHFQSVEAILDHFSPDTYDTPRETTCDDFNFVAEVQFGGSEGIYLDCYAEGRIQPECEKKRWHIGTYKTLETSLSAMQTLGALGGTLTYYASEYLWKNGERFLSDRELRIKALQNRRKEKEAEKS